MRESLLRQNRGSVGVGKYHSVHQVGGVPPGALLMGALSNEPSILNLGLVLATTRCGASCASLPSAQDETPGEVAKCVTPVDDAPTLDGGGPVPGDDFPAPVDGVRFPDDSVPVPGDNTTASGGDAPAPDDVPEGVPATGGDILAPGDAVSGRVSGRVSTPLESIGTNRMEY